MSKQEAQVRVWLLTLLAKLETFEVINASYSEHEVFGENIELKVHFGEVKTFEEDKRVV